MEIEIGELKFHLSNWLRKKEGIKLANLLQVTGKN
jgi:hypothetical protein